MRPVTSPLSADMTAELVKQIAIDLPRWEYVDTSTEAEAITLHLTHSTRLFGFVDDIHVTITPTSHGCRITATSKSRVGKGDLGQNPRNLKELVGEVHRRLEGL